MITIKLLSHVFFVLLLLNLSACSEDSPTQSESDFWNEVDELITSNVNPNGSGYGLLVVKDGVIAFSKGWGMSNIANNIQFTADTPLNIASLTKQFTACAILILYERNELGLHDNILTYLPELPAEWSGVTIHHLLTHQSGIPDYVGLLGDWNTYDGLTNQQALQMVIDDGGLEFTPGTNISYSNTAYIILAMLVERISRTSYPQFMEENIFNPLQMTSTFVMHEYANVPSTAAVSYSDSNQPYNYDLFTYGAGNIYSTLNDMYKWDQALYTEQIISQESFQLAITDYTGGDNNYGYGWMTGSHYGYPAHRHGGYSFGNLNFIIRVPDRHITYLMLSNGGVFANNGFDTWTTEVQDMIFDYYF
ncbi:serine hydrolase domain-containing protein [Bacteroidota bacterium]